MYHRQCRAEWIQRQTGRLPGTPETETDVGQAITAERPPYPEHQAKYVERKQKGHVEPDDREDFLVEYVYRQNTLASVGTQASLYSSAYLAQGL